ALAPVGRAAGVGEGGGRGAGAEPAVGLPAPGELGEAARRRFVAPPPNAGAPQQVAQGATVGLDLRHEPLERAAELVALVLAEHPPREREAAARAREMVVEVDAEQARVEVHGNDLARHGDGRRAAAAHHRAAAALSAGPDLSSQGGMRPRARLLVLCGVALAGAVPAAALAAPLTLDGAYTAARQGKTAHQILGLAFPGARI